MTIFVSSPVKSSSTHLELRICNVQWLSNEFGRDQCHSSWKFWRWRQEEEEAACCFCRRRKISENHSAKQGTSISAEEDTETLGIRRFDWSSGRRFSVRLVVEEKEKSSWMEKILLQSKWCSTFRIQRWSSTQCHFGSMNLTRLVTQRSRLKGAIGVAFISEKMPLTQDDLVRLNADNNSGDEQIRVSQNKFEVFTNHRVISFCAETNEQLDRWHQKIIQFLKENMSSSDFDVRSKAAQEAVPLLKAKSEAERENLYRILAILEANGIFVGTSLQAKDKGGKLEMEEENGIWTEYYFSLLRGCLYFKKDSRSVGNIPFSFSTNDCILLAASKGIYYSQKLRCRGRCRQQTQCLQYKDISCHFYTSSQTQRSKRWMGESRSYRTTWRRQQRQKEGNQRKLFDSHLLTQHSFPSPNQRVLKEKETRWNSPIF